MAAFVLLLSRKSSSPELAGTRAPLAMFQEQGHLNADPAGTLHELRNLGVGVIRVSLSWKTMAPAAMSARPPAGFDGADPRAYTAATWKPYDTIVKDARAAGIGVEFLVSGGAPRWALGPGVPHGSSTTEWRPSPLEYGKWVRAIAVRYNGHFPDPVGTAIPAVHFWEIWNEPNFGQNLAPQALGGSRVLASPGLYRGLLNTGWNALQTTGHAHDTIIIGSLSPRGFRSPVSARFPEGLPGYFSSTKPLQFLRALYCVDAGYHELRGRAAANLGCPDTAAGSAQFRAANPGLFGASGLGVHPYPFDLPPNQVDSHDPDYAEFGQLPRLAVVLDRLQEVYGSSARLQLYNTEFGYITDPPNRTAHHGRHFLSPPAAAAYLNWAEYLSWRDPRVASTMQYLLYDPYPKSSGFATGLRYYDGTPKPGYDAYRLPLYLPVTSATHGRSLEVWGCVRPAHYASLDRHGAVQHVEIQFRPAEAGIFRTLTTLPIHNPGGYFDTRLTLPASGSVRLLWRDPAGQTVLSRTVAVTEH